MLATKKLIIAALILANTPISPLYACDQELKERSDSAIQAQSPYTLITKQEEIPLFTSQQEQTDIFNITLATQLDPGIAISNHRLTFKKNNQPTYVDYSCYTSDKPEVIILAIGLWAKHKAKVPLIQELTKQYDVIVFNYAWQNPASLRKQPAPIPLRPSSYFENTHLDVIELATCIRNQKKYARVIGYAECYSAFIFLKAEALKNNNNRINNINKPLFDTLILDSAVLSTKSLTKSVFKNPALCCNPLDGQAWPSIARITGNKLCLALIDRCMYDYSIKQYLPNINIPVLLIRGNNDTMISKNDFETMFALISAPKAAFITPFHHVNSFKRKNARKECLYITHLFLQNPLNIFIQHLQQAHTTR